MARKQRGVTLKNNHRPNRTNGAASRTLLVTLAIILLIASALSQNKQLAQALNVPDQASKETPQGKEAARVLPAPFSAKRFLEHVSYLASDELEGRNVGSQGSAKAVEYITRHLKQFGISPLAADKGWTQSFPVKLPGQEAVVNARNILGISPGKGALARDAILISAHHDHMGIDEELQKAGKDGIFNGADDNASGCAALLLWAEALDALRAKLPDSYRTVIFAFFDAEERGLVGSRFYLTHPLWPVERTAVNVNFDMVGRLGIGRLLALDSTSNPFMADRIVALAPDCGLRVETRLSGGGRSDHVNFLDREIPAVHFSTGTHSDYHQVTDEASRIDSSGGARITWFAFRLVEELLTTTESLKFKQPARQFDIARLLNLVSKLGIMPSLNAQSGKYPKIQMVAPGSPAAKNGLASGDEITAVNGAAIERLEDAAILFAQLRFEEGLRLTVLRKGEKVEVRLPAEVFRAFSGPAIKALDNDKFEVEFRFKAPAGTKSVTLRGSFNKWDAKANPMDGPDKDGVFSAKLTLPKGVHEYKFFIVDTEIWLADPSNLDSSGQNGNSVLTFVR
jgi:Peptidase family M28/PDZ domain/Glycogen recognition site of AMP-activated protein kinase